MIKGKDSIAKVRGADTKGATKAGAKGTTKKARDWQRGWRAETFVLWHLRVRGWRVLERRWRGVAGEIDLIVRRGETLAFVEVKLRSRGRDGAAFKVGEVLGAHQRGRIERSAADFVARYDKGTSRTMRFDLAVVEAGGGLWRLHYFANAWRCED